MFGLTKIILKKSFRYYSQQVSPLIPKTLDQIVKKDLFDSLNTKEISEIWLTHSKEQSNFYTAVLDKEKYEVLARNLNENNSFIFPIVKEPRKFFTLFGQWQMNKFLLTFLEDYRLNPSTAEPYFSLSIFDEFIITKNVALVQAEFLPYLTKDDGEKLTEKIIDFYTDSDKYEHVISFNKRPEKFDFNEAFPETL